MALFLPLIQPDMITQNISHYRITGRLGDGGCVV